MRCSTRGVDRHGFFREEPLSKMNDSTPVTKVKSFIVTGVESFILLSGSSRKNPRRSTSRPCSQAVQEWNKRT